MSPPSVLFQVCLKLELPFPAFLLVEIFWGTILKHLKAGESQTFQIWNSSNEQKCEPDDILQFTKHPQDGATQNFSFRGFQFRPAGGGDRSETSNQIVSCSVAVCHEDDSSSACTSGCYGN